MIEHSICMFVPSTFFLFDHEHLKQVIEAAGVDNTFFGSDLGQKNNPTPVEGSRQMIGLLPTSAMAKTQSAGWSRPMPPA